MKKIEGFLRNPSDELFSTPKRSKALVGPNVIDQKTKAVAHYILSRLQQRGGGVTRLMKLLYLADLEGWRYLQRPLTSLTYFFHRHGPFTSALYDVADQLRDEGRIRQFTRIGFRGLNRIVESVAPYESECISPGECRILDFVVREWGRLDLDALLDAVYATEPMVGAKRSQELNLSVVKGGVPPEYVGVDVEDVAAGFAELAHGEKLTLEEFVRELRDRDRRIDP